MPRALKLTADQEATFRRLWTSGVPVADIANELKWTADTVTIARKRLGLPPRNARTRAKCRRPDEYRDPTPEEIAERAAEMFRRHLERKKAEHPSRMYRGRGECGGRVYPSDVFGNGD